VDVSTASETNGQVVVRLDNHMPPNYAPIKTFYVAIGPPAHVIREFLLGSSTRER
jgi:hypothetical protein